jgi:hypothetical protein
MTNRRRITVDGNEACAIGAVHGALQTGSFA